MSFYCLLYQCMYNTLHLCIEIQIGTIIIKIKSKVVPSHTLTMVDLRVGTHFTSPRPSARSWMTSTLSGTVERMARLKSFSKPVVYFVLSFNGSYPALSLFTSNSQLLVDCACQRWAQTSAVVDISTIAHAFEIAKIRIL